jgi:hypothetical protein
MVKEDRDRRSIFDDVVRDKNQQVKDAYRAEREVAEKAVLAILNALPGRQHDPFSNLQPVHSASSSFGWCALLARL